MTSIKECAACGKLKGCSEFYKRHAKCKLCYIDKVKKYRAENPEKIKAYEKKRSVLPHRVLARSKYSMTERGIVSGNASKRRWAERNPKKRMASISVGNSVRDGRILKPEICERCKSAPPRIHGHHDDYDLPLVVRWLCPRCHNDWHRENGEGLNAG